MSLIKSTIKQARSMNILLNIGGTLDIPTGVFVPGMKGESVLNGGQPTIVGMVGISNSFKSTIAHYITLTASSRLSEITETNIITYDTEVNMQEHHLHQLAINAPGKGFKEVGRDVFQDKTWIITNKGMCTGDVFWNDHKAFLKEKTSMAKSITVETPMMSRDGVTPIKILVPTQMQLDSLSEFEGANTEEVREKNDLGDKARNTMFMKQGLLKSHVIMDLPSMTYAHDHYGVITAHVGKDIDMASGPVSIPTKKLAALKNGDKIKGVTDKFLFLTGICYHAFNTAPLLNAKNKTPEYPKDSVDNSIEGCDLHKVSLRIARNKFGATHTAIDVIVSQTEGLLSTLTEFHYLKDKCDRFGLVGNNLSYVMALCPDVNLSRTKVRGLCDTNHKLRRAINITSEIAQMKQLWRDNITNYLMCDPEELYKDIKELGYDWDLILDSRSYWLPDNYNKKLDPYLSSRDILMMRKALYIPYWYPKEHLNKVVEKVKAKNTELAEENRAVFGDRKLVIPNTK